MKQIGILCRWWSKSTYPPSLFIYSTLNNIKFKKGGSKMQTNIDMNNKNKAILSRRILKDKTIQIGHATKDKWKSVSSAFVHTANGEAEKKSALVAVEGILQPVSVQSGRLYKFQLLTENEIIYLDPPLALAKLLKKYTWERFCIKGIFSANNVLKVKTARLETEDAPSIYDNSKNFDLAVYRNMIDQGLFLEPKLDEIA